MNGKGIKNMVKEHIFFENGSKYEGEYKNNLKDGAGKYT